MQPAPLSLLYRSRGGRVERARCPDCRLNRLEEEGEDTGVNFIVHSGDMDDGEESVNESATASGNGIIGEATAQSGPT